MIPYNGLSKIERLNSKLVIDALFGAGNASLAAFPIRAVWMKVPKGEVPVSLLISVPKKRFHHAVDRNRMKRMLREAYRKNKHILWDKIDANIDANADDDPQLSTLNPQPSTLNPQLSTLNPQPSSLTPHPYSLALGFVCITSEMVSSQKVERAVVKALTRISEQL